jgi:predicted secreted Zn-dependent protease
LSCGHDLEESLGTRKILFALAVLISMPVAGEPLVRLHTSYYYFDGPSATVLAAQLDQNGPVGADGNRYAGRTAGTFNGNSGTSSR